MADYKRLFFAILVVGIAVRIFTALALPDAALSDSLYHLAIAKHLASTGFLPFKGIELMRVNTVPPPFFHFFVASSATAVMQPVGSATAISITLLVSVLQLLMAFILLKKLFPNNWVYGLVFFTVLPLITKYSGVNYTETLASIFVLLSFYLFVLFKRTGSRKFIFLSVFSLAAMSMAKLNATILLPAFILLISWEAKNKKMPWRQILAFALSALLLSGLWFGLEFLREGQLFASNAGDVEKLVDYPFWAAGQITLPNFFSFCLQFNKSLWAFPPDSFFSNSFILESLPFASLLSPEMVFLLLTALTLPITIFLIFASLNAVRKRKPFAVLLLFIYLLSFVVVVARGRNYVFARMILPAMPLLSITFLHGFEDVKGAMKKAFFALLLVLAVYSFVNLLFFSFYYYSSFQKSQGLYSAIAGLSPESKTIISGNHFRAVRWFSERKCIGPEEAFKIPRDIKAKLALSKTSAQEIYKKLVELNITHLAVTCIDDPWDKETITEMIQQGMLEEVFSEECSALYKVKRVFL